MFNLIVSGGGWEPHRDSFGSGRVLEYTDAAIAEGEMTSIRSCSTKLHNLTDTIAGYQSWLDCAVATMELPASESGALTDEEFTAARLAMRDAARTGLGILRRAADCARC